ncbi:hypothetical protein DL93DRAFT_2076277 [Clavulina sp. PMI_390]|nr:hypothetical protein DL93DRAFT_2076277 [Clavulina sp. PMI_390]
MKLNALNIEWSDQSIGDIMESFGEESLIFPVLESIRIYHENRYIYPDGLWWGGSSSRFDLGTHSFPSLKSLSFCSVTPSGKINAPSLQQFTADGQGRMALDSTFHDCLQTFTQLQSLELTGFRTCTTPQGDSLVLPNLITLTLRDIGAYLMSKISELLRVPKLENLCILWRDPKATYPRDRERRVHHLLHRDDLLDTIFGAEGGIDEVASLMMAMRGMLGSMLSLSAITVQANQPFAYAILAPILPFRLVHPLGESVQAIDITLVDGCEEEDQLLALALFIRDLILRRYGQDLAIRARVPRCLEGYLDTSSLPSSSISGWHEKCVCRRCDT